MKNRITDIFFDFDHTLWDFEKNSDLAFQVIFQKNKLKVDVQDFLKVYRPINFKYWQLFSKNMISKETLRFQRLDDVFQTIDQPQAPEVIHQISEDYIAYLPTHNYLIDGAEETLERLSKKYRLHIITNGFANAQRQKIKNARLTSYFKSITTSEDAEAKKPSNKIFEYALAKANTVSAQSLMIGDNLEADIYGAEKAGFQTIFFDSTNKIPYSGIKIKALNELQTLLL